MTRVEELEKLSELLEVVDLGWRVEGDTHTALMQYSVYPDPEDEGKFRAYYGKGRYKQVGSLQEGKDWVQNDHLKGKLLRQLKLKERT